LIVLTVQTSVQVCSVGLRVTVKYSPMGGLSQGIRTLRRAAATALRGLVLLGVFAGAAAIAWKLLMKPPERPKPQQLASEHSGPGYLVVAGAAVDLELIAPDGRRVVTAIRADTEPASAAGDEAKVDCSGYGYERESNSTCTASVTLQNPAPGDYRVVVTSSDSLRGETLNVGWGGATFRRSGGFAVPVIVEPGHPVAFTIIVAHEGASMRTQPKALQP
jgi:hypothetical protein